MSGEYELPGCERRSEVLDELASWELDLPANKMDEYFRRLGAMPKDESGFLQDLERAQLVAEDFLRKKRTRPSAPEMWAGGEGPPYVEAMTRLVAAAANADPDVIAFRQRVLDSGLPVPRLVPWTELEVWLRARQGTDERKLVTIVAPRDAKREATAEGVFYAINERCRMVGESCRVLEYCVPDSNWTRAMPIAPFTTLDALRLLSSRIAKRYHWVPAAACAFILTGVKPLWQTCRITYTISPDAKAPRRITLDVDASLGPKDVEKLYRNARLQEGVRQAILGDKTRTRKIGAKHLRLAVHWIESETGETVDAKMDRWNKGVPDPKWRYDGRRNFDRDSKKAIQDLAGRYFQPPV